jgi:hypothetical protein
MQQFGALEKVVGKVKSLGSASRKIANWIESSQWKAPVSPFGKNPFTETKNLVNLNKKYKELFPQFKNNRSLLNYNYLSQRIVIIKNFIEALDLLQDDFIKLDQEQFLLEQEIKNNSQGGDIPTFEELLAQYTNSSGQFDPSKRPVEEAAKQRANKAQALLEFEKIINEELRTLLRQFAILKQVVTDPDYANDKIKFTGDLIKAYKAELQNSNTKLSLYAEEVETGQEKEKVQKSEDAYLSGNLNATDKKIKIRIKK